MLLTGQGRTRLTTPVVPRKKMQNGETVLGEVA